MSAEFQHKQQDHKCICKYGHAGKLAGEAKEGQLAGRLEGSSAPQDGFAAVARLAWGLLLAQYGSATTRGKPCADAFC